MINIPHARYRSVTFLQRNEDRWACFLVTYSDSTGAWRGHLSFRQSGNETDATEVRTADIFLENSETEIHQKARGLGRPLLIALLESALYTSSQMIAETVPQLSGRFRSLLVENSLQIGGDWSGKPEPQEKSLETLHSLYSSYRLDQVAHFICLLDPSAFEEAVDEILGGQSIDFRSRDRMQFAMMVVDHIEHLLPLPDFESWTQDFLEHAEAYRSYAHTLHRKRQLP